MTTKQSSQGSVKQHSLRAYLLIQKSVVEMNLIVHSGVGRCEQIHFFQWVQKIYLPPPPPTDCSTWYFVAVKWVHDGYLQVQKRQVLDVHLCVANVLERHVGLHVSVSEKQHMKYLCVFHQIEVEVQILFLLLLYL